MSLSLKLFGAFAVRDKSETILSLRTRKTRALLAYLAVNADTPQPRERLMALLWSDRDERQARQSLNAALSSIRRLVKNDGSALLDADGERVTLHGAALEIDVARFLSLSVDDPVQAAALYDGPFLDGLSIPNTAFEEWLATMRSELHSEMCDALQRVADTAASRRNSKQAIDAAKRLVVLDPLRESGHRLLMRMLYESGERAAALRQYQACAEVLKHELQVEPNVATKSLVEEIRADGLSVIAPIITSTTPETPLKDTPPPLPDKPSIAILPFDNLGSNPQARLLADGLTEDLITALTKVPELLVIARNSSATWKGKAMRIQEVAEALGVRYILVGSVQKSASRVRVTSQLIDATNDGHLWAERYDRPIKDIFALQDEIVRHVLVELQVKLTEGGGARVASRGTRNLEAWLLRVQGATELRRVTREGNIRARELLEAAHKADPKWARPLAGIADCYYYEARNGWSISRQDSIAAGVEHAERSIEIDPEDPYGYSVLRLFNTLLGNHEKALLLAEKAASIAPYDQTAVCNLAAQLIWMEEAGRAIATFERGMRLAPIVPKFFQRNYGLALQIIGHTDRAIAVLETLARHEPEYLEGLSQLAAAYVSAGRIDAAHATTKKILEQDPAYTHVIPNFRDKGRAAWLRDLLIKAGLPK